MPPTTKKQAIDRAADLPGYMSLQELDWLASTANALPPGSRWAEIGCLCGRSLLAVGLSLPSDSVLISVDHYWGRHIRRGMTSHDTFAEILQSRNQELQLHAIAGKSVEVPQLYQDQSLDVVFIDAAHDYKSVVDDVLAWWPKVKKGGLFCGHDFNPKAWPGVVRAVEERFAAVDVVGSIWSARVA